jgi:hypothetical protein
MVGQKYVTRKKVFMFLPSNFFSHIKSFETPVTLSSHDAMKNVAFQYARTLGRGRQLQSIGALVPFRVRLSVDTFHTRYLFLPQESKHIASTKLLPDMLQQSILSLLLRATQAGFAPTCFQTISSTHVHFLFVGLTVCVCRRSITRHVALRFVIQEHRSAFVGF